MRTIRLFLAGLVGFTIDGAAAAASLVGRAFDRRAHSRPTPRDLVDVVSVTEAPHGAPVEECDPCTCPPDDITGPLCQRCRESYDRAWRAHMAAWPVAPGVLRSTDDRALHFALPYDQLTIACGCAYVRSWTGNRDLFDGAGLAGCAWCRSALAAIELPSAVTLARVAADKIHALCATLDDCAREVGTDRYGARQRLDGAKREAYAALRALYQACPSPTIAEMGRGIGDGYARPSWAVRVVALASKEADNG